MYATRECFTLTKESRTSAFRPDYPALTFDSSLNKVTRLLTTPGSRYVYMHSCW